MPTNVENLIDTFRNCTSLKSCPDIPSSAKNLSSTFRDCTNLVEAPNIANGVEIMDMTFTNCENLIKGPDVIPESVNLFKQTFQGCTKLRGELEINANITDIKNCSSPFYGACSEQNAKLKLKGNCPVLSEIVTNANNPNITL